MSTIKQLCVAIREDDLRKLKQVWDAGVANSIHITDDYRAGFYVLHYAVDLNRYHMLKYMLENGADPNVTTKEFANTPLAVAHWRSKADVRILRVLMRHGANPYIVNCDGDAPIAHGLYKSRDRCYLESYLVVELVTGEADNLSLDMWRVIKPFIYKL